MGSNIVRRRWEVIPRRITKLPISPGWKQLLILWTLTWTLTLTWTKTKTITTTRTTTTNTVVTVSATTTTTTATATPTTTAWKKWLWHTKKNPKRSTHYTQSKRNQIASDLIGSAL